MKDFQDTCSNKQKCDRARKNENSLYSFGSDKDFCFDTTAHTLVRDSSISKFAIWKENIESDEGNRRLYSLSTAGMTKRRLLDELLLRRLEDWENDE